MGTTDGQRAPHGLDGHGQVDSMVFTPAEVQRLRFWAYRRAQGYMRPPAAVRPGVERLCDEIVAYLRPLPRRTPPRPPHTVGGSLPPLWRAWAAAQQHPTPSAQVP
jgi:hypothetical protein